MKKINNNQKFGVAPGTGYGVGYSGMNQRQPNAGMGSNQFANPQYMGGMGGNQDLMYQDDFYDDEVDFDTEEAQAYALQMQAQGLNPLTGAPMQISSQDMEIQRAEQMLGPGYEIMEEELDEDYEPTGEEIEEYAKYLGMDLNDDRELFYIAKEGLKAPLPNPWKPCKSPGDSIYYYNFDTHGLQKEHPCDDYYKNYYSREKVNLRKKKEEQVIKKQIKQQQKKQQQQLSNSMNSTSNQNNQSALGNNSIHQMNVMMNMSGINLDVSQTAINERLQNELEQIMDEFEERKIQHERKRREELKKVEQEKVQEKMKVQDDTKMQVDLLKKTHSQNLQKQEKGGDLVKRRETMLEMEKEQRLRDFREQERQRMLKSEKQLDQKIDKKRQDGKREQETRHALESDNIKQRFKSKLEIERDRIREDNNRLLEESGDIDFQVRLFRSDLLEGQIDTQKFEIEQDLRQKLKDYQQELKKKLERERDRIITEIQQKLEKEREKEQRKIKLEQGKIEEKKEQARKEYQIKLRDEKKRAEKENNQKIREKRLEYEDEIDNAKMEVKKQTIQAYEMKSLRAEKEYENWRYDYKQTQDKHELQCKQKLQLEQDKVKQEFEEQWNREKQEYLQMESENQASHQAILKDISKAKYKVKDLLKKQDQTLKELEKLKQEISDLDLEKRGKQKQLKSSDQNELDSLKERQLQRELRGKEEELETIVKMIKDKREANRTKMTGLNDSKLIGGDQNKEDYKKLLREVDNVKLMIMELKTAQNTKNNPDLASHKQLLGKHRKHNLLSQLESYSIEEIETYLELNLPALKHKREKYEQDRLILRQLIANIERNRMKIRQELMQNMVSDSHSGQIVMNSIKDKIDEQAVILEEEEKIIKEKYDKYRIKEEKLRTIREKVKLFKGDDKFGDLEDDDEENREDKKSGLLREIQLDYDKYLKLYQNNDRVYSKHNLRTNNHPSRTVKQHELSALHDKWHHHLIEEANEDLRPLVSMKYMDDDEDQQLFRPRSLYNKYQLSGAKYSEHTAFNHIYEREVEKVKQNRGKMRDFLHNQQRWLNDMRSQLSSGGAVPASNNAYRSMNHIGSSDTLYQIKNNLSHAMFYH